MGLFLFLEVEEPSRWIIECVKERALPVIILRSVLKNYEKSILHSKEFIV